MGAAIMTTTARKPMSIRNRIARLMLISLISFILLGAIWLKQPFSGSGTPSDLTYSAAKLKSYVKTLSVDFHPRVYNNPQNLQKCINYLKYHFEQNGARVELQEFEVANRVIPVRKFYNVRAYYGPVEGNPIVIGAHYDSCGDNNPGSDDNASGVAGLMALSELFKKNPPAKPVELVAYCLEEPPFFGGPMMGSFIHAKRLKEQGVLPELVIVLEMIGFFTDQDGSQKYPVPLLKALYPSKGNFVAIVGRHDQPSTVRKLKGLMSGVRDLPLESISSHPKVPGVDFSDHRNFWQLDWPAVMITDTSFMRYDHYHKSTDTYDRLDYNKMSDVIIMVYEAVQRW